MANKRMLSKDFIYSDSFSGLPMEERLLYFYLNLEGDDDGFVCQAKRIARAEGINDEYINELVSGGFLYYFPESNVYLLRHWHINNNLRGDRYTQTIYQKEYSAVTLNSNKVYQWLTDGRPMVDQMEPQNSIDKVSIDTEKNTVIEGSTEGDKIEALKKSALEKGYTQEQIDRILTRCGFDYAYKMLCKGVEHDG